MTIRWSKLLAITLLGLVCADSETIRNPAKRKGAGPLFQIVRGDKWGFIDRTGRVIVAPAFIDERDFFHGLAAVEFVDQKWGYIDEAGKVAIPARFDEVRDFLEGLAPVRIGRKWGYIDTSGRMAIEPQYQSAGEFHEGLARIHVWNKVACTSGKFTSDDAPLHAFHLLEDDHSDLPECFPEGGKFGYIDKAATVVIAAQFFVAQDFAEGLAAVRVEESKDSKFGYIDRTGHFAIEPRFSQAARFSEGLAAVETNVRIEGNHVVESAWGFIDKTGVVKIAGAYDLINSFSEGLARVAVKAGESVGYIDHDGKMIIAARYNEAWDFSEGRAAACDDQCVYIDRTGARRLRDRRAWWPFSDGLAVIGMRAPQVYVDKRGRAIAPYSN